MHYNVIKTAAGARTRMRLPMLWKADAVAAEELPEAVFWVFIGGERVRVEKTPGSEDEYIFPALQAGQYAWDLVVDAQVVLHGVLKVRGSAVPPGGGEVCGTLLVDAPAMVLVLSPGPRGEVGPVGPQGLSAYEVALQHGYEGSEDKWAEELSGAQAAATAAKEQATEAGKQATAAANSATDAADSSDTAGKQATAAANSAKDAAASADTAGKQATAAANSATDAAASADTAGKQATAASNSAKDAADSSDTAGKQATAAANSAKEAADSSDTAGKQATAASNSAAEAASSAEGAAASATAAATSATAAATAADVVKCDLLPMSVDWLHTQFEKEIGEANFTVTLNDDATALNVAFAHDVTAAQCEKLLALAGRVCPKSVMVVLDEVPLDYTELDYLESSGTQYIDTGIVTDGACTIGIKFKPIVVPETWSTSYLAGWEESWTSSTTEAGASMVYFSATGNSKSNFAPYVFMTKRYMLSPEKIENYDYTAVMDVVWLEGSSQMTFNGQTVTLTSMSADAINTNNPNRKSYHVFGINGKLPQAPSCIHNFRIQNEAGEYVFNAVPVLDETGEPYMWDTVSRQKLPNAGTGRFGYRIKGTDVGVKPNATTYSLRAPRDPYYVAPSGVNARKVGENELEIIADTEETTGEGWEWFANTAEAYEYFGIVPQEEFSTE